MAHPAPRLAVRGLSLGLAGGLLAALLAFAEVAAADGPFPVIGKPAPDFFLTNQDGHRIQLSQFGGKLILLNFIYTNCTDLCPLTTASLVRVQRELVRRGWWATAVVFVTVTTDPVRDTPAVLTRYAGRFKADLRGWHFLTGNPVAVSAVHRRYGIEVQSRGMGFQDHALPTFIINRAGVVLGAYEPIPDPQDIIRDLARLREGG